MAKRSKTPKGKPSGKRGEKGLIDMSTDELFYKEIENKYMDAGGSPAEDVPVRNPNRNVGKDRDDR